MQIPWQFFFDVTAFVVALSILFAAIMWGTVWVKKYPVPIQDLARIFTTAFLVQLAIYIVFSFVIINIQLRAYMVRTSIIVICLSQAIPLFYTYRAWTYDKRST